MTNKEIKNQLQKGDVKFTIKGITSYTRGGENNEWGNFPKVFEVTKGAMSIYSEFDGMNVDKWGHTYISLYTYDMLGKKSTGKIQYSEITILK